MRENNVKYNINIDAFLILLLQFSFAFIHFIQRFTLSFFHILCIQYEIKLLTANLFGKARPEIREFPEQTLDITGPFAFFFPFLGMCAFIRPFAVPERNLLYSNLLIKLGRNLAVRAARLPNRAY